MGAVEDRAAGGGGSNTGVFDGMKDGWFTINENNSYLMVVEANRRVPGIEDAIDSLLPFGLSVLKTAVQLSRPSRTAALWRFELKFNGLNLCYSPVADSPERRPGCQYTRTAMPFTGSISELTVHRESQHHGRHTLLRLWHLLDRCSADGAGAASNGMATRCATPTRPPFRRQQDIHRRCAGG